MGQDSNTNLKVSAAHLRRDAYLYVRQSTMHQVLENTESTKRQYQLRDRALSLGWQSGQIKIIDCDQAQSGASQTGREGFQRLAAEVSLGNAGLVMGLEVSRLARNNADWHRLLELCSFTDTLILDQDGLYDPSSFNDRLILGVKGTLSEAELHILKSRMQQGLLNKAKRGELKIRVPVGFEYDEADRVILSRDTHIQDVIRRFFAAFRRLKSARAVGKEFRRDKVTFPHYCRTGPVSHSIVWGDFSDSHSRQMLRNPRYAGAFAYGKTKTKKDLEGKARTRNNPPDQWTALIKDAHDGYISWDEFESNRRILNKNSAAYQRKGEPIPPREGPALLQGLTVCGKCGRTMRVRYHQRKEKLIPDYICPHEKNDPGINRNCQCIAGGKVDEAIGKLVLEMINQSDINAAIGVQEEMKRRIAETDKLRRAQVERCRYDADIARRRYMQTDPDKRYVAKVLETEWNEKLGKLDDAQKEYEQASRKDREMLNKDNVKDLHDKLSDFSKIWKNPSLGNCDRKRIVRLLIEDVTMLKNDSGSQTLHIRFKGGASKTINLPRPEPYMKPHKTDAQVIALIDQLLDQHPKYEIVEILKKKEIKSGTGRTLQMEDVHSLCHSYKLSSRYSRLRKKGMLTQKETCTILGICPAKLYSLAEKGLIKRLRYGKVAALFEMPDEKIVKEIKAKSRKKRNKHNSEVQYAT